MSASSRPLLLLGCLCLGLAAIVAKAGLDLTTIEAPPSLIAPTPASVPLMTRTTPSKPLLTDLLRHPPFDPSRGRSRMKATRMAAPASTPPMTPVAVVTSSDREIVMFEQGPDNRLVSAERGETVKGWRITKVSQHEIEFQNAKGVVEVVRLRPKTGERPGRPPLLTPAGDHDEALPQDRPVPERTEPTRSEEPRRSPSKQPHRSAPVWTPEALEQLVSKRNKQ